MKKYIINREARENWNREADINNESAWVTDEKEIAELAEAWGVQVDKLLGQVGEIGEPAISLYDIDTVYPNGFIVQTQNNTAWGQLPYNYYSPTVVIALKENEIEWDILIEPEISTVDGHVMEWDGPDSCDDLTLEQVSETRWASCNNDMTFDAPIEFVKRFYDYDEEDDVWRIKANVKREIKSIIEAGFKATFLDLFTPDGLEFDGFAGGDGVSKKRGDMSDFEEMLFDEYLTKLEG